VVSKQAEGEQSAASLIERGEVDLVINVPREYDALGRPDGLLIRRAAVDAGVGLITDLQLARAVIEALRRKGPADLRTLAWDNYVARRPSAL
jgi:carbamoyl-phosphate synthase large subunit